MPEDEVRACAVELKLAHEAKLRTLLHSVRGRPPSGGAGASRCSNICPRPFPRLQLRSENEALDSTVAKDAATLERMAADISALEGVVREVAAAAGVVPEGGAAA